MKRLLSIALCLVLTFSTLPVFAINAVAAEISNESSIEQEEYVYYSDLFYGYSYYLSKAPYLTDYYTDTQGILNRVYTDFMNSPKFAWTNIKNSLAMATDLKEWTKMVTDAFGVTSFTYEKALDAANVDFATQLTGGLDIAKAYGTELKCVKKINDILKIYDTFDKHYDVSVMTQTEVFNAMFATIGDSGVLVSINKTTLTMLQKDILPHISTITSRLSKGADILTAAKTIATGIMMEDFRMELIDEILSNTSPRTMLYDGMYRLKNQLKDGFVSYFLDQYLKDEVLNKIADEVVEKITTGILGNQAGIYAVISAFTKVASWIVFDCIFDVPDIDDLTKQMVLSEYAYNLHALLKNKVALFNTQFETEDIYDLETLATAYSAATNAALAASDKLKLSTNSDDLKTIVDNYSKNVFYNEWIESALSFVKNTSVENRTITDFGEWKIETNTTLRGPSDTIQENSVYCTKDGFNGEIYPTSNVTLTIPKNEIFIVNNISLTPSIGMNYTPAQLINYGALNVSGDFSFGGNVYNYGELNIVGDLIGGGSSGGRTRFYMSNSNTVLRVGGDVFFYHEYDVGLYGVVKSINFITSKITNGTVEFNGKSKQTVKGLSAANVVISNTSNSGVEFATTTVISTLFDHKGNNFSLTNQRLDSTFADYDKDGMKDNVDTEPTFHNHTYTDNNDLICNSCGFVRKTEIGICGDNVEWMLDTDSGVLTLIGSGATYNYVNVGDTNPFKDYRFDIQSIVIGDGITRLGNRLFKGLNHTTSVIFGKDVTTMGYEVFYGCSNLSDVTLNQGLTNLGSLTFYNCAKLTQINIPSSVRKIDNRAFKQTGLTSITVPNTVKETGYEVFMNCYDLSRVTYSKGVTMLNPRTFENCTSLKTFYFTKNMCRIRSRAFYGCTALQSINFEDADNMWGSSNGNEAKIASNAFGGCNGSLKMIAKDNSHVENYAYRLGFAFVAK